MSTTVSLRADIPMRAMARKMLTERAAAQVAQYPQYADHFRPFVLGVIKRDIRTKMGLAFVAGEIAIMHPTPTGIVGDRYYTAWSSRNACDTSVPAAAIEVV